MASKSTPTPIFARGEGLPLNIGGVPPLLNPPPAPLLSRHYEKTNEAIFFKFFDPFFVTKTGLSQKNDITIGSGVKKYAGWCIRIAKSSTDDLILALFHFLGIFLIRLFVVPGQ